MKDELSGLRRDYTLGELKREELLSDPIEQFELWLKQVIDLGLKDPTAMTVATVDATGQPSQRIVLLKQLDARGFVFYTNYASKKAQDIGQNAKVSLHFPWHALERQVKVCGVAEKVSAAESLKYFSSRPEESQLAAWASHQSHPVESRTLLMSQFQRMKEKFKSGKIPLPDFWGGYRIIPTEIEFWQGGSHRLHDRFVYQKDDDGRWDIQRLAP
ncbi:pyridoxamine 5'-phosphate oxidase [Sessilibacter corallicola]|uniref:Pyridoxine/pyridoxamine 5'-phosphate oxidase n=1 Tax=Sessilibacter corallicola TaxID=2904075 RepID=A0ABQ0A6H8_9GAMM